MSPKPRSPASTPKARPPQDAASDAPVQDYFTFKIHALSREHSREIRQVLEERFDLTPIEWRVMSWIATDRVNSVRDISAVSYLAKSQISHGLNLLVHRGFASAKSDSKDARNRIFALTAAGRRLFAQVTRWHRSRQSDLIATLEPQEYATMMQALDKLLRRFRDDRERTVKATPKAARTTRQARSGSAKR